VKILFVHQNFPGQFLYLAPEMARRGHDCLALTDMANTRDPKIKVVRYRHTKAKPADQGQRLGKTYTETTDRGVSAARAAVVLRDKHGYVPDVIFGHSGWGETLFLKQVWPTARLIVYAEFFYNGQGADNGFDPEFSHKSLDQAVIATARSGYLGLSLLGADAALSPTHWQASTFPAPFQQQIEVIFDGVDTDVLRPDPSATVALPNGQTLKAGDEVLTFINRNLEPYRGYHIFMRSLPDVLAARPDAQVVIVGADGVSYGSSPETGTWKDIILSEVADRIDMSRVHFMGKVGYQTFVALMQISRVHAYLTYPFVLSWSTMEAMSCGAHIVGSRTPPVQEMITDGVNGTLVDFFDVPAWSAALIEGLAHPDRFIAIRQAARETILNGYDLTRQCLPETAAFIEAVGRGQWSGPKPRPARGSREWHLSATEPRSDLTWRSFAPKASAP
jgi:glycosyltransferase involved in cell wall biosynthesis